MIAVLTGGNSSERTVALWSAETVIAALKLLKLNHVVIDCAKRDWLDQLKNCQPQLAFVALHGQFGEDGQIQKVLERAKIPYTGSGPMACRLAWDKIAAKEIVRKFGIAAPQQFIANSKLNFPIVIKPNKQGSSYGVSIVNRQDELEAAIKLARQYDQDQNFLIEERIKGTELTCGVIDIVGEITALPLVEIVTNSGFFDYQSKYTGESGCEEIVPARVTSRVTEQIQSYSKDIFRHFSCRHYARIDWILRDQTPYFLELNILPGLTKNSLIIKELQSAGIPTKEFIRLLAEKALF